MNNDVRNNTLDVAKGLGIWLVIVGHASQWGNPALAKYIYSFHMPFFFMISGYLYKKRTTKETAINGISRLIIPYFIIGLSCAIPAVIFGYVETPQDFIKRAIGTVYSVPKSDWTYFCTPIWFLTCLFCTEVIYSVLRRLNSHVKHIAVVALFCAGLLAFHLCGTIFSPWNILNALLGIFFYHLGAMIRTKDYFTGSESTIRTAVMMVPTAFVFWYGSINSDTFVNLSAGITGNVFYFLIASISGAILVLQMATILRFVSPLKTFGRNTIILLGYNYWVMALGNHFALSTQGWVASLALQVPFYFLLCWLSEKNKYVSFAFKRTPITDRPSNQPNN